MFPLGTSVFCVVVPQFRQQGLQGGRGVLLLLPLLSHPIKLAICHQLEVDIPDCLVHPLKEENKCCLCLAIVEGGGSRGNF